MAEGARVDNDLEDRIRAIIDAELELEPGELTPEGHFVDEYEADSLALITVVARIDKELRIQIPNEMQPELVNLDRLMEAVRALVREPGHV